MMYSKVEDMNKRYQDNFKILNDIKNDKSLSVDDRIILIKKEMFYFQQDGGYFHEFTCSNCASLLILLDDNSIKCPASCSPLQIQKLSDNFNNIDIIKELKRESVINNIIDNE